MPTRRTVRVAEVLRKELSACLTQCNDLEGMLITISSVELPPDLKQAYVYVSTLNPDLEHDAALKLLHANRREWQGRIGRRLGLKFTPQLIFRFDTAMERGDRVMQILSQIEVAPVAPELEIDPYAREDIPLTPAERAKQLVSLNTEPEADEEEAPVPVFPPVKKLKKKRRED